MKHFLLFFITLLAFSSFGQDQAINSKLNNWSTVTYSDGQPDGWVTINQETGILYPGVSYVEKSSDANHLDYSLKLSTVGFDQVTMFGYALIGNIGDNGPEGGKPFAYNVDSLIFDAKFDLLNKDTANVLVVLKLNGMGFDFNVFELEGSQSSWRRYAFPLNQFNITADSIILGFTAGNINDGPKTAGSWIQYDNIRFKVGNSEITGITNNSFENWTPITAEEPDDWFTYNQFIAPLGISTVVKTSSSSEGSYAAELRPDSVVIYNDTTLIDGVLLYGEYDIYEDTMTGKPFVAQPTNFTGDYKWLPNVKDTARINLTFTALGSIVGYGELEITDEQTTFSQFDIPLTIGDTPDSVLIIINGGQVGGSILTIDNLSFNGGTVGIKSIAYNEATTSIYPNPMNSNQNAHLNIALPQLATVNYNVINSLGQTIDSQNIGLLQQGVHKFEVNTSHLNRGVYFIQTEINDKTSLQKLIIK